MMTNSLISQRLARFFTKANVRQTLEEFMAGPLRNGNVRYKNLESYVRKSDRMIEGRKVRCLDRGSTKNVKRQNNMDVNPRIKRTGFYKEFDDLMVAQARKHGFDAVYVENVLNDFLPDVLKRLGYTQMPVNSQFDYGPPSFYKLINHGVQATVLPSPLVPHIDEGDIYIGDEKIGRINIDEGPTLIRIANIELRGSWQGKGVGTAVFNLVFAFARKKNKPVVLTTDAMRGKLNQARQRKLYERLGFKKNSGPKALRFGRTREEYIWHP